MLQAATFSTKKHTRVHLCVELRLALAEAPEGKARPCTTSTILQTNQLVDLWAEQPLTLVATQAMEYHFILS